MRYAEIINENDTHTPDQIKEAVWWLERWITGNMSNPEWDGVSTTMDYIKAFDILHEIVGNRKSTAKSVLWRVIIVSKKTAMQIDKRKLLPVSPNGPFQSFSGEIWSAIEFGGNDREAGELPILVSAKPDPALIMFGMADLKTSRNAVLRSALNRVKSWHYQDEVFVRVTSPLPLLSVDKVDAVMDDDV